MISLTFCVPYKYAVNWWI